MRVVLYECPSSGLVVYEEDHMRCLRFRRSDSGDDVLQACADVRDRFFPCFLYTDLMAGVLFMVPRPRRVLFVGFGGGVLSSILIERLGTWRASITAVEPDAEVLRVALDYFGADASHYDRFVLDDGFSFMKEALEKGEEYDIILIDAYHDGYLPPRHFRTPAFFETARGLLSPGGVMAMNAFDVDSEDPNHMGPEMYRHVFPEGSFSVPADGNRVFFFVRGPLAAMVDVQNDAPTPSRGFRRSEEAHQEFFACLRGLLSTGILPG